MPDIVIGNSASYDGYTATAAQLVSAMGSTYASASSGALTLKSGQGVAVSNADSSNPLFIRDGAANLPMVAGGTISSNTEGYSLSTQGLFSTALTINSGVYLYGSSGGGVALEISVPGTITNNGYIMGGGANGNSLSGGNAISITSSGVTVTNNSGAYIAGGGGSGAVGRNGGGGGGAGGGNGGNSPGAGGGPGSSGSSGSGANGGNGGGGGSGGGGAASTFYGTGGGGGGGRILPGTGGSGGSGGYGAGGAGGSANGAGGAGGFGGNDGGGSLYGCGGGGGWAASGGSSYSNTNVFRAGGSGGKAVEDNGNTYTLTNNGTIYGTT